jgi:hypothetical protein
MHEFFVGIDWGGYAHQLCVLDAAGARWREASLEHNRRGIAQLDAELAALAERLPVAVERAEGSWSSTCSSKAMSSFR